MQLRWNRDCGGATSYAVYRGALALGYGSLAAEPGDCAVSRASVTLPAGQSRADFFLVVPNDGLFEGAYGVTSSGDARAPAAQACLPPGVIDQCAIAGAGVGAR